MMKFNGKNWEFVGGIVGFKEDMDAFGHLYVTRNH